MRHATIDSLIDKCGSSGAVHQISVEEEQWKENINTNTGVTELNIAESVSSCILNSDGASLKAPTAKPWWAESEMSPV